MIFKLSRGELVGELLAGIADFTSGALSFGDLSSEFALFRSKGDSRTALSADAVTTPPLPAAGLSDPIEFSCEFLLPLSAEAKGELDQVSR